MKKYILLMVLMNIASFAQYNSSAFKLGAYFPSASGSGFIIGYENSRYYDPKFSFGWSIDWYRVKYTDSKIVNDFNQMYGVSGNTNELRARTSLNDIPLMAEVTFRVPIDPKMEAYLTGSFGAEMLLINYSNFRDPSKDDFKTVFDYCWRTGAGITYNFSRSSELLAEISYHSANPGYSYQVADPNGGYTRTYERNFDMSGIMLRVGFRFYH